MTIKLVAILLIALTLTASTSLAQEYVIPEKDKVMLQNYSLTMEKVTNFYVVFAAFTRAAKTDPELKREDSAQSAKYNADPGVDSMIESLAKSPRTLALLKSHGFTARNYALTLFSVFHTMLAVDAFERGISMAAIRAEGGINEGNVKLFIAHKAAIAELEKKYPLEGMQ